MATEKGGLPQWAADLGLSTRRESIEWKAEQMGFDDVADYQSFTKQLRSQQPELYKDWLRYQRAIIDAGEEPWFSYSDAPESVFMGYDLAKKINFRESIPFKYEKR